MTYGKKRELMEVIPVRNLPVGGSLPTGLVRYHRQIGYTD
jgi:hypothetical protein